MSDKGEFSFEKVKEAAEAGISYFQWMLAVFYRDGIADAPQDDQLAAGWFNLAALNDHEFAQYELAKCYLEGRGVEQCIGTASYWLEEAAKQGHGEAQVKIGKMLYWGDGIQANYDKAFKYLSAAWENEQENVCVELGLCYYNGKGTQRDYAKAAEIFRAGVKKNDALFDTPRCLFPQTFQKRARPFRTARYKHNIAQRYTALVRALAVPLCVSKANLLHSFSLFRRLSNTPYPKRIAHRPSQVLRRS